MLILNQEPVFVTGMGAVTAAGRGVPSLWNACRTGHSLVKELRFERIQRQMVTTAAHILDQDLAQLIPDTSEHSQDRFSLFAIAAAEEALKNAHWPMELALGPRTAVIIGSGIGGATTSDAEHFKFYVSKERGDSFTVPKVMPSAAASHLSMEYGARGPSFCVSSACSSGSQAIGLGLTLIRAGLADRALVGGSECLLTPATFRAWEALRVMTPTLCRPFSIGRDGMVLGEGAAILLLEKESEMERRGAQPLARLSGFGTTSDAGDIVRPSAVSCAQAMKDALNDAGLQPGDVGYVNAHGTGTILNDRTETEALFEVFGDARRDLPISSTKPIHGHTLGAAGAIELVVTIEALRHQLAPPTINWMGVDSSCIGNPVPNEAQSLNTSTALSNSFAFGGINACLVVQVP